MPGNVLRVIAALAGLALAVRLWVASWQPGAPPLEASARLTVLTHARSR